MSLVRKADVIIVGSGATGSLAAWMLSKKGRSVILIDAGPLPNLAAPNRSFYLDPEKFPYHYSGGQPYVWDRVRAVGGRMNIWTGASLRMSNFDFHAADFDGFGERWPLDYENLAEYYTSVERLLGVTGHRDGLPQLPDGEFIDTVPEAFHWEFKRAIEQKWTDRSVIVSRTATVGIQNLIAQSMATGKLELFPEMVATKILTSSEGPMATGITALYARTNDVIEFQAKKILVCASAIESAMLLFRSGIGNSTGVLGKYLMDHTTVDSSGIIPFTKSRTKPIRNYTMSYIPSFLFRSSEPREFRRGYGVQCEWHPCPQNLDPLAYCSQGSQFGANRHAGHFFFRSCGEILPRESNRVIPFPREKDTLGIDVADISFRYSPNELGLIEDQKQTLADLARVGELEIRESPKPLQIGMASHELGTARMGSDPRTSVLNQYNQCWDIPNVYVMDGAAFVSSGFQNPTLTMMALCARACDRLSDELK
jgi:choline dehydrogenase-like flavoprotein